MSTLLTHYYLYFFAPKKIVDKVKILAIGKDEVGNYFVPSRSIFHPKGGGQPDDEGFITLGAQKIKILKVKNSASVSRYYIDIPLTALKKGEEVTITISQEKRQRNTLFHTAGHLLADTIAQKFPHLEAYKGAHIPYASYLMVRPKAFPLEFSQEDLKLPPNFKTTLEETLQNALAKEKKVHTTLDGERRGVQIEGYPLCHCGGTHLDTTEPIKEILLTKIKYKKREGLKISYEVTEKKMQ